MLFALVFLAGGLAFAVEPSPASAKALFESKCSICHPVSRPLGKTKDRKGWTATVTRMQQGNGCPITDEEAGVIIGYLTKIRGPVAR
jgi:cytochrome c5